MPYIPDPWAGKTVRIRVEMRGGRIVSVLDGNPPALQEGALADLIVDADTLQDARWIEMQQDRRVPFLASGTPCAIVLNSRRMEPGVADRLHEAFRHSGILDLSGQPRLIVDGVPIQVQLLEDLRLVLRGAKSAQLCPCRCWIPVLEMEAGSLNQAYTVLSTEFEVQRLTHGGNAFRQVYCLLGRSWRRLDALRQMREAEPLEDGAAAFQRPDAFPSQEARQRGPRNQTAARPDRESELPF